jgi:hypothetical protein
MGFGADRMYPVRVVCHGCPRTLTGTGVTVQSDGVVFDPAVIERKASGTTIETRPDEGWSWKELDLVEEAVGGAPIAQRDALKLLAALIQHTDTKPEQQRLVCLDKETEKEEKPPEGRARVVCQQPFMLINDLGNTFGVASIFNANAKSSVNFDRWSQARVWKDKEGCVAYLPKSLTGTLEHPMISEPGRQFLAGLLGRLSDAQIRGLFEVSRVELRTNPEPKKGPNAASVDDWVNAFKKKRDEVASRRCAATH